MNEYQLFEFPDETIDVREPVIETPSENPFELCRIEPQPEGLGFFSLRPYQHDGVEAFFESLNRVQSSFLVMATGLGKTVFMAEVALRWPDELGRVLIIAHTEELIDQAAEKIGLHLDEATGIEMGERREIRGGLYSSTPKVLVASVQTLSREKRRRKFDPMQFGLVLIDEAHHANAASYKEVAYYFLNNPQCRIGGVTATPERGDGKALGDMFKECCFDRGLIWGIREGWLVDVEQKTVVVEGLDFSKCRTTAGDLNEKDLESAMTGLELETIQEQEEMLHKVARPVIDEANGRPTMIFCVTRDHASKMSEICNRYGSVTAEVVTGDTPKELRLDIINRFRAGAIQILCVVAIGVEGFDARVDVVAVAKPTKAKSRYLQMIGRGTRPLPRTVDQHDTAEARREAIKTSAKPSMVVLDFVGIAGRHELVSAVDVLSGEYGTDVIQAAKDRLKKNGTESVLEALQLSKEEIEEKQRAKAERARLKALADEEERQQRAREAALRKNIKADVSYSTEVVPLDRVVIPEVIGQGCYRGGSSDKQVAFLMKLGIRHDAACRMTKGQAGAVITKQLSKIGGEFILTFGPHMGKPLKDIPKHYLANAVKYTSNEKFKESYEQYVNGRSPVSASSNEETPF